MGITVGPVQGTRFPGVGDRRSWGQLGKPLAGSVVLTWRPAIFLAGKMVRDRLSGVLYTPATEVAMLIRFLYGMDIDVVQTCHCPACCAARHA